MWKFNKFFQLLNPAQRREIAEYEKRKKGAEDILQNATLDREKTRRVVNGPQFHRGILMFDSAHNCDSEIYGETAKQRKEQGDYRHITSLERHANLAVKNSSIQTNGNILNPQTLAPRVKIEPFYQAKGGT